MEHRPTPDELRQALAAAHATCEKLRHLLASPANGYINVGTSIGAVDYETKPLVHGGLERK